MAVDINAVVVAAIIVVGTVAVARFFAGGKRPPQQSFRCGRCHTSSMHTARTIEAWRNGKTKFFCNSCHGEWIRNQPREAVPAHSGRSGRSGCLSALLLFTLFPAVAVWAYLWK
jgi:hypothetical protein